MIRGIHALLHSTEAEALRTFIRNKLGLKETDVGNCWHIFATPTAGLSVQFTEGQYPPSGTAEILFCCDDIEKTVSDLHKQGVEFTQAIEDHGHGLITCFLVPGGFQATLYQPYNK